MLRLKRNNQQGIAVLELAVVFPLMLFLVLIGLEYAQSIERIQWSAQLSREVASRVYRRCKSQLMQGDLLQACIRERAIDPISNAAGTLAPGTEFIVARYRWNAAGLPRVTEEGVFGSTYYRNNFRNEGYTVAQLTSDGNANRSGTPGRALRDNQVIIVVSAYIPLGQTWRSAVPGFRYFFPDFISSTTVI